MAFFVCFYILLRVLVVNFFFLATSTMYSPPFLYASDDSGLEDVESSPDCEDLSRETEEIPEREHNGAELTEGDLELIDRAREDNDIESLEYLQNKYPSFFDEESGNSLEEGLNQLEEYLEEEFPGELAQSEREADILEEEEEARNAAENTEDSNDNSKGGGSASGGGGSGGNPGEGSSGSGGTPGPSSRVLEGLGLIGGVLGQIGEVLDNLPLFFSGFMNNLRLPFD